MQSDVVLRPPLVMRVFAMVVAIPFAVIGTYLLVRSVRGGQPLGAVFALVWGGGAMVITAINVRMAAWTDGDVLYVRNQLRTVSFQRREIERFSMIDGIPGGTWLGGTVGVNLRSGRTVSLRVTMRGPFMKRYAERSREQLDRWLHDGSAAPDPWPSPAAGPQPYS